MHDSLLVQERKNIESEINSPEKKCLFHMHDSLLVQERKNIEKLFREEAFAQSEKTIEDTDNHQLRTIDTTISIQSELQIPKTDSIMINEQKPWAESDSINDPSIRNIKQIEEIKDYSSDKTINTKKSIVTLKEFLLMNVSGTQNNIQECVDGEDESFKKDPQKNPSVFQKQLTMESPNPVKPNISPAHQKKFHGDISFGGGPSQDKLLDDADLSSDYSKNYTSEISTSKVGKHLSTKSYDLKNTNALIKDSDFPPKIDELDEYTDNQETQDVFEKSHKNLITGISKNNFYMKKSPETGNVQLDTPREPDPIILPGKLGESGTDRKKSTSRARTNKDGNDKKQLDIDQVKDTDNKNGKKKKRRNKNKK